MHVSGRGLAGPAAAARREGSEDTTARAHPRYQAVITFALVRTLAASANLAPGGSGSAQVRRALRGLI